MKKGILKRLGTAAVLMCMTGSILSGCGSESESKPDSSSKQSEESQAAAQSESEGQVFTENITGTADGYDYELWKDNGDTTFTVTDGGTFSCEWSNINNALFRRGQKFDCTKTYQELGNVSIDFGVDYQPDGNSYMCVYGWTRDPLIEFYIVESWGSWRPPGAPSSLGTVTVDGAEYDIYKTTRYEQPSIDGTKTFDQYWSVRKAKPTGDGTKLEGTISISKHFDAWKQCGLEMGKMYEIALTIEGYQSAGKAKVYKNELNIGGEYKEADDIEVTVNEAAADGGDEVPVMTGGAGFFECGFEDGEDDWLPRGGAQATQTTDNASDGEGSLFVSGRQDNWNGACIMLDPEVYKAGSTYSFSVKVMQNSGEKAQMKLTMQYTIDGENYDQVAIADAESGEWVTLENLSYTIPEGAKNLILYVESPDSLTDFYIDEAKASAAE